MANSAMRELQFEREKSTNASSNVLYQAKYLPDLLQRLEKDPQSVLDDCEQFRQSCKYNKRHWIWFRLTITYLYSI
jgi:hypothetical protein